MVILVGSVFFSACEKEEPEKESIAKLKKTGVLTGNDDWDCELPNNQDNPWAGPMPGGSVVIEDLGPSESSDALLRKITLTVGGTITGRAVTWTYPNSDGNTYEIPTYEMTVDGINDSGMPSSKSFTVLRFGVTRSTPTSSPKTVGLAQGQSHTIKTWLPSYDPHSSASLEKGAWQVYDNFLIHDGPDNPLTEKFATVGCIELCGLGQFIVLNDFIISLSGSQKSTRAEKLAQIGRAKNMTIEYLAATRPPVKLFVP